MMQPLKALILATIFAIFFFMIFFIIRPSEDEKRRREDKSNFTKLCLESGKRLDACDWLAEEKYGSIIGR